MLPEFDIIGKTVLVTGAGRGIGKGIALVMAEAGADVAVTGLTEANAASVAQKVRDLGRRGIGMAADATRLADTERLVERVLGEFGHLDVLVNCVGDSIPGTVASMPDEEATREGLRLLLDEDTFRREDQRRRMSGEAKAMSEAAWHAILDVNLTQAFTACHAFGPHLLERRRGCVINVSSFAGLRARALVSAYAAAKAGLIRFTESLALEWAPYGIRVNGIAPGSFPDPEQLSEIALQAREEQARRTIPLGRLGRLREVGLLAVYLACDAASYMTGQTVAIDGGLTVA